MVSLVGHSVFRLCMCCVSQQDSCGEEERSTLVTVVKPTAKPRRAKLLSKGRKLNNKKRGRPKKAAPAAEKKNKKNQSALDLLHAKTLSAAPPQGGRTYTHVHTQRDSLCCVAYKTFVTHMDTCLCTQTDTWRLGVPFTNYLPKFSTIPRISCC